MRRFEGATGAAMGVFASGGGLDIPHDLEFGDGQLFVSIIGGGRILRFDGTTGAFVGVFASGLNVPTYIAFTPAPTPVPVAGETWGRIKARYR